MQTLFHLELLFLKWYSDVLMTVANLPSLNFQKFLFWSNDCFEMLLTKSFFFLNLIFNVWKSFEPFKVLEFFLQLHIRSERKEVKFTNFCLKVKKLIGRYEKFWLPSKWSVCFHCCFIIIFTVDQPVFYFLIGCWKNAVYLCQTESWSQLCSGNAYIKEEGKV